MHGQQNIKKKLILAVRNFSLEICRKKKTKFRHICFPLPCKLDSRGRYEVLIGGEVPTFQGNLSVPTTRTKLLTSS